MNIVISAGRYKSIGPFTWRDIPPFALLTGVNGSGKSQFLEILSYKLSPLSGGTLELLNEINSITLEVEGESFEPHDVTLIKGEWEVGRGAPFTVAQLQHLRAHLQEQISHIHAHAYTPLRQQIESVTGKQIQHLSTEEFEAALPRDFALSIRNYSMRDALTQAFFSYRFAAAEKRELGETESLIRATLGPPPWEILDSILAVSELPYRVSTPVGQPLLGSYQLRLYDAVRQIEVDPDALSSGEKVLMGLVMWLFRSRHEHGLPKLLLLDEPDAHLHPQMARQFLDVVQTVLVEQLRVRVIMTTHSPSTVALAPGGSIFEMQRDGDRIVRSPSRNHAVNLLTAGLVTVSPGTRYILVEDEADVEFFSVVWSLLTEKTPLSAPKLPHAPSLAFIRASLGKGSDRTGGGKPLVQGWVGKLGEIGLSPQFQGLIDGDIGNDGSEFLRVLSRYSIENYLLDPLCVYTLLIEFRAQPAVEGIVIGIGEEHSIRTLDGDRQQRIVDAILAPIAGSLQNLSLAERSLIAVEFSNGSVLHYPRWFLDRRGKDLLLAFQTEYGGNSRVHHRNLLRSYQRLRMIPLDLRETFKSLQTLE